MSINYPNPEFWQTDIDAQGLARIVAAKGHTLTAYTLSDTQAPTKIWEAEQDGTIHHALLTFSWSLCVACSNRDQSWQVCVLDALDGQPIATIPVASEVQLIFDDVRSRLISIDERKTALFWKWQADRQEYQLAGSLENVLRLAFSADGKWIAIGTLQGGISCYGAESLKLQQVVGQFLGSVVALAISPDSEVLVAVWDNGVSRAWNLQELATGLREFTRRSLHESHAFFDRSLVSYAVGQATRRCSMAIAAEQPNFVTFVDSQYRLDRIQWRWCAGDRRQSQSLRLLCGRRYGPHSWQTHGAQGCNQDCLLSS